MEPTTSEKILDVAQSHVIAGGYNGFSYADISDAVGIRKASIHHHFPTKSALVSALVERYTHRAQEGLRSISEHIADPVGQLETYLNYWQTCILDASQPFCVCAMLAGEMQMLPDDVASKVRLHFENLAGWLTSVLKAGIEQNLFNAGDPPEIRTQILMAAVHGAMLSARAMGDPKLFHTIVNPQIEALKDLDHGAKH